MSVRARIAFAISPALLTWPALAQGAPVLERYVDVAAGSDASGNGTLANPWKTVTHALAVTSGQRRIHMAAGEYSSATGEVLPINLPPEAYLVGAGRGVTWLRANSGQVFLAPGNAGGVFNYYPLLEGASLLGVGGNGVLATGPTNELGIVSVDFVALLRGVWVFEDGADAGVKVRNSRFVQCSQAIALGGYGHPFAALEDCSLDACVVAFQLEASANVLGDTGVCEVAALRTEVRQCFRFAQMFGADHQNNLIRLTNSLVAGSELLFTSQAPGSAIGAHNSIEVYWSTLADNGGVANVTPPMLTSLALFGSILWNSGTSLDPDLGVTGFRSNTNLPIPGTQMTALDPKILAPDYRLATNSPLIDLYPNLELMPSTDFEGDPRTLDFAGFSTSKSDVGRDERTNLLLLALGAAKLGATVNLVGYAPSAVPVCAFAGAIANIQLDPGNWVLVQPSVSLGCGISPATIPIHVPADIALVGLQAHVQAGGLQGGVIVTSNRATLQVEV